MAEFGLTNEGFLAKRFSDIVEGLRSNIKTEFGFDINSVPDNKFKILVNILALPLAENWESAQALQTMMDLDQASGLFLDYLCASKLIYRQTGVKSNGEVFTSILYDSSLTLPASSSFYNNNNDEFLTTTNSLISNNSLHQFKAYITEAYSGDITLVLNGVTYTRNTVTEGSLSAAISALETDITNTGTYFLDSSLDGNRVVWDVRGADNVTAETSVFTLELTSGFDIDDSFITRAIAVEYTEEGDFSFLANTVTTAPAFTAIEDFYNGVINGGRYRETDEELRQRFKLSPSRLGKATAQAIKSAMLSINGVSDVSVEENHTMMDDTDGRPPKSVEVVIKGGDDLEVAETLYDVGAAGIEFVGDVSTEIRDVNNQPYLQYYSRVINKYIWVRLTYTKYDEEEFPSNGAQLIQDTILQTINDLPVGKDVIQGRIASNIYRNVTGIEVIDVELFGSTDIGATPIYSASEPVRISSGEEALQLQANITILEG